MCLVMGSLFIYIVILNDLILFVNIINIVFFKFFKEGNYFCLVINKYGFVFRVFIVLGKFLIKGC